MNCRTETPVKLEALICLKSKWILKEVGSHPAQVEDMDLEQDGNRQSREMAKTSLQTRLICHGCLRKDSINVLYFTKKSRIKIPNT